MGTVVAVGSVVTVGSVVALGSVVSDVTQGTMMLPGVVNAVAGVLDNGAVDSGTLVPVDDTVDPSTVGDGAASRARRAPIRRDRCVGTSPPIARYCAGQSSSCLTFVARPQLRRFAIAWWVSALTAPSAHSIADAASATD